MPIGRLGKVWAVCIEWSSQELVGEWVFKGTVRGGSFLSSRPSYSELLGIARAAIILDHRPWGPSQGQCTYLHWLTLLLLLLSMSLGPFPTYIFLPLPPPPLSALPCPTTSHPFVPPDSLPSLYLQTALCNTGQFRV